MLCFAAFTILILQVIPIGYLFGTVIPPSVVVSPPTENLVVGEDADHRRQGRHDAKYLSKRYYFDKTGAIPAGRKMVDPYENTFRSMLFLLPDFALFRHHKSGLFTYFCGFDNWSRKLIYEGYP